MGGTHRGKKRGLSLLAPLVLVLLPLLVAGSGFAGRAQAGAPVTTPINGAPGAANNQRPHVLALRVYFRSIAERDSLAVEFGAEELPTAGGYLVVLGDEGMRQDLLARGVRVEVDQALTTDANSVRFGSNSPNTFYGGYKTVEEMQALLYQYAATYPNLAEVVDYGNSWCKDHPGSCTQPSPYNGYDMLALHITNRSITGPKPVFWFETGIHSREIATPEVAIRYISTLLDNYNNDPDMHWLVDYQDIWVVPMVNPDGHHIVEAGGGGNSPYYQRKNANNTNGCTTYPPSSSVQFGTDNNRNFDFLWNCCGGSSTAPCDQTYHGPIPASDPEAFYTEAKIRQLIPDQRGPNITDAAPITTTGVYQSMHSNAQLNLFPWGFQTTPHAPNDAELRNIGKHMQATNAFPSGNSYSAGQPPELLYAVDGDTADWGYGELGAASYTTEVGGSSFFPSYSTIDNSIWPLNRGALIYQAKVARTPYLLAHGPDSASIATTPMTVTQGTPSQLTGTINFAWSSNSFSQNVGAAEYYIDTPPWAGGTPTPMAPTDGMFNSPTEGAQATIDTTSLAIGRHIIFVRGRGANQFQGYDTWGPVTAAWLTVTGGGGATVTVTATPPAATSTIAPPTVTVRPSVTGGGGGTPLTTPTSSPSSTITATPNPCAAQTVNVGISNFMFTPQTETISVGSTIHWTNNGGTHTTTSDTPGLWDSGTLPVGGTFDVTFNTPGTYTYHCMIHGGAMNGAITVLPPCITPSATNPVPSTATTTRTTIATTQPSSTVAATATTATGSVTAIAETNTPTRGPQTTSTAGVPTSTSTSQATNTTEPAATSTPVPPTVTVTACPIQFQDVPPSTDPSSFYPYVRCLACKGILGGYACGGVGEPCGSSGNPYFRPSSNITRGQIAKVVSNSAGFSEPGGAQIYTDVASSSTSPFYDFINRLSRRGYMGGYPCGGAGEPCDGQSRPYFRPGANASRGQLSKIVANAAQVGGTPSGQTYEDVAPASTFYLYIEQLSARGVMGGYACGRPGEPCGAENRPYFRPNSPVTRGQAAKIVANTFFPSCVTPARR